MNTYSPPSTPSQSDHLAKLTALYAQAERYREAGQNEQAISTYYELVARGPRQWQAYLKLGTLLNQTEHRHSGLIALRRAVELAPDEAVAQTELGMALKRMGRQDESLSVLDRALELEPHNLHAAFSKAELLLRTNRTLEALAWFEAVLAHDNDADNIKAISRWLRGVARLTLGDYQGAWSDYEARIHHPTTTFPELIGTRWTGQPLEGKTILLAYEQRFGDVIQFSRFVPDLVALGANVILQAPPELTRLFRSLGSGVDLIRPKDPLPAYDYCQLVTSIPAILGYRREQVTRRAYLKTEPGSLLAPLPQRRDTVCKVGLVWAGKPIPDRSIPLLHLVPLLRHRRVTFYSFQLGEAREQIRELGVGWLISDLSPNINDFHDSSVLMQEMDLIITIDTAAAHQAGALGLPTWLLLIHYSDWRWGPYGDARTPWYPSIRIFRQTAYGSWDSVALELEEAFAGWVNQAVGQS